MFSRSLVTLVSKKFLRLKCTSCCRLLGVTHFYSASKILKNTDKLVCLHCKTYCIACGLRCEQSAFSDPASNMCDRCLAKQQVAETNVYYRFPVLNYKSCPFSVDKFRDRVGKDD